MKKHLQHHKSAKVVFKTPFRECAHADKGCCPKCLDPMALQSSRNMTFHLGRYLFRTAA